MDAVCGIIGQCDERVVSAMFEALAHRGKGRYMVKGEGFAVASSGPVASDSPCLVDGEPRDANGNAMSPTLLQESCAALGQPEALDLKGSFAAAIKVDGAWWLMRDRLGRKPLYYAQIQGNLIFASELKGLLASGLIARRLDLGAVDRYLTWRSVPCPDTLIAGVQQVLSLIHI